MRIVGFLIGIIYMSGAFAATPDGALIRSARSFLTPQKFPKTFADASFTERMNTLTAGYEDWEADYDDNTGRCIRGCAYHGITIEEELIAAQHQTQQAVKELQQAGYLPQKPPVTTTTVSPTPQQPLPQSTQHPAATAPQTNTIVTAVSCNPRQPEIRHGQAVPVGEPLMGHPKITSPYGERIHPVTKKRQLHKGIDFSVPSGTSIFSPASGDVTAVWTDNTCGRGITIRHADGFETTYCHLNKQLVRTGDSVSAGCQIGLSGNTGRSTGPHLHYGIKRNGTYINPAELLGR